MVFYKFKPNPLSKTAVIKTVSTIRESILLELGYMNSILYSSIFTCRPELTKDLPFDKKFSQDQDLILGSISKTVKKLEAVISKNKPKVIFILASSQNQELNQAKGEIFNFLEKYPEIRTIDLTKTCLANNFNKALEQSLLKIVQHLARDSMKTLDLTYNILGSCSDMYKYNSDLEEINRMLEKSLALRPNCILSSHTSIDEIAQIPSAWINIVIREEALATAQYLESHYSMPYFYKRPYGLKGSIQWLSSLADYLNIPLDQSYIDWEITRLKKLDADFEELASKVISIGGHSDIVEGISSFALRECQMKKGIIWHNNRTSLTTETPYYKEEEFLELHASDLENHILMASGEIIEASCLPINHQISNPDANFKIKTNTYPLVGFSGALELIKTWSDCK